MTCQRSSSENSVKKTATSGHDAKHPSGNDVIHDNKLQVGFTNQAVSMVTEDEAGYTSLKKEKELIDSETKAEVESEYPKSKPKSIIYEEITDSPVRRESTGYIHPQSHYDGYEYAVDESEYLPPSSERYINPAVTKGTEDEYGYDYPQIQPNEYEEVPNSYKD